MEDVFIEQRLKASKAQMEDDLLKQLMKPKFFQSILLFGNEDQNPEGNSADAEYISILRERQKMLQSYIPAPE
ncbi:hypothetical protein TVAG_443970 [Trichomonas vaginalis G3]|uniref:Uncharacterized protein n=1 Tax=Trichomonas vaginalis (strain ATCC PRA-98 / G3) TaxID=412133 RepID=A2E2D9_TRIV3|nr:hypothetical protein TVAGG3_0305330 [Trichomonas vaginalis G3]EAY13114.1 hypothetical protein TVAG_443970 [Trichomonas vaginalis G3]KAI5528215.1 hypothetical protein TVAGG3_0305330 [Trichomonas vaginalis G3]|eukprot:XP_001325337.1 hypothetical protein [Trichomonas vaginalis G3]